MDKIRVTLTGVGGAVVVRKGGRNIVNKQKHKIFT